MLIKIKLLILIHAPAEDVSLDFAHFSLIWCSSGNSHLVEDGAYVG